MGKANGLFHRQKKLLTAVGGMGKIQVFVIVHARQATWVIVQ
jgi:hypothetical protein